MMRRNRNTIRSPIALAGGFCLFIAVSTASFAARPTAGRMVDAGGHRLYLNCAGEGAPAVILENGLGNDSEVWHQVQPEVEKFTRVCSYDRAGIGRSEAGPMPRTSARIVSELHTALQNAGVAPPYVLVGHSLGGVFVRHFARLHPDEVAGIVTVDGSHEDQAAKLPPPKVSREDRARALEERAAAAPEDSDEPEVRTKRHLLAVRSEMLNLSTKSADEIHAAPPLPPVPLVVLVHGKGGIAGGQEIWKSLQRDIASRSPNSTFLIVDDAGHYIQNDDPQVVIDSIRTVVEGARP